MNEPDHDQPLLVENERDTAYSLSITVTRESGAVVHEGTYEAAPDSYREVYNLQEADPEGVETFTVEVTTEDQRESIRMETNACYGPILIVIDQNGELRVGYAEC